MKRILFSFLMGLCFLTLTSTPAWAKTCKPKPDSFYYSEDSSRHRSGEYFVAWEGGIPVVYYYSYRIKSLKSVVVAAEFNKVKGGWTFYGKVPHSLIEVVHWHWKEHKTAYKNCLGDYAWRSGNYYYAPYRTKHKDNPAFNWVIIGPRGPHHGVLQDYKKKKYKLKKKNLIRKKK